MTEKARMCLITRGDDLGSFMSANLAIIDAFRRGVLRNTSIMVPSPHFEHGAALVREERDLCVGLHFTITSEWDSPRWGPVLPPEEVPSLVDTDGFFFRDPMKLHRRGFSLDEALREAKAQLDLARSRGLDIRYIDEHMGTGWIYDQQTKVRLWHRLRDLARQEGLVWHRDFETYLPRVEHNGLSYLERLKRQLLQAAPGTYVLVTHPSYNNGEMRDILHDKSSLDIAQERLSDYQLLCDPELATFLHDHAIEVLRYDYA